MTHEEQKRKIAEELAKEYWEKNTKDWAWSELKEAVQQGVIKDMLPLAEYVLKEKAEAYTSGYRQGWSDDRYMDTDRLTALGYTKPE